MANINSGLPIRLENGVVVMVGADTVLNTVEGSFQYEEIGPDEIENRDRGILGDPQPGNQNACTWKLNLKYTSLVAAAGMIPKLRGPLVSNKIYPITAAGKLFTFPLTIKIPDYYGATVGDQIYFAKAYLPRGTKLISVAGAEFDRLELDGKSAEMSPEITRYS